MKRDYAPKRIAKYSESGWPTGPAYRPTRRHTRELHWAKLLFAIFFVLFVAGGLYSGYIFYSTLKSLLLQPPAWTLPVLPIGEGTTNYDDTAATDASPAWGGQERVNVLILGVDQREAEKGQPTRSDTMIVVTLDPASKTAGMLSIPRDLWVAIPLPEVGEERINSAHFFGDYYKVPGGGPALAKKTVALNFGIPIHYYARVDFQGFIRIIDAIGGVNIDVERPIRDDEYPDNNYGYMRIFIPAGLQHMDGQTALQYVRTRHGDSDFGRLHRQQRLLLALREQGLQLGLVTKLPVLFNTLRDAVKTDVPPREALMLAQLAAQVDTKNIMIRSIDASMVVPYVTPSGADVLIPKRDEIKKVIDEMFRTARPPAPTAVPTPPLTEDRNKLQEEGAKIEVQNGTDIDGLAAKTRNFLEKRGYRVVRISNAELNTYTEAVLICYTDGKKYTKDQLIRLFNISPANVRSGNNPRTDIDFRLIVGSNTRIP